MCNENESCSVEVAHHMCEKLFSVSHVARIADIFPNFFPLLHKNAGIHPEEQQQPLAQCPDTFTQDNVKSQDTLHS